jgi:hypothetical protein
VHPVQLLVLAPKQVAHEDAHGRQYVPFEYVPAGHVVAQAVPPGCTSWGETHWVHVVVLAQTAQLVRHGVQLAPLR